MFAMIVKIAQAVKSGITPAPKPRTAEPWPPREPFVPMPTCEEEYHSWRCKF